MPYRMCFLRVLLPLLLIILTEGSYADSETSKRNLNGFIIDKPLIPAEQVFRGGPPKDGIPSINKPKFITVAQSAWLNDKDRIVGINIDGQPRAYPVRILNYHEVVNDRIDGQRYVISFCPLCNSAVAYRIAETSQAQIFGVSGLLYNSDVLLYDHETNSLWSQLMSQAINGPLKGKMLERISLSHTSWQDWKESYPDSLVLSRDTGFFRNYDQGPYSGYRDTGKLYFPVAHSSDKLHNKDLVLGVEIDGHYKAYPFKELQSYGKALNDTLNGQNIVIRYNPIATSASAFDSSENMLPTITAFWFAWFAFYPDTELFLNH